MYKVEVDPKLFVTCRLCLDEMGQYQIVPRMKEQIKFCYDISVDPFDGLPQLICKKCDTFLTDVEEKKKLYQKNNLKLNSVEPTSSQQQDTVSSTQLPETEASEETSFKLTLKKKKGFPASTSIESDTFEIKQNYSKPLRDWRKNYNKLFACRFCTKEYKHKKSVVAHLEKHKALLTNFSNLLRNCQIRIPRIDEKTNFICADDMVVVDEEKMFQNNFLQYRVVYRRKTKQENETSSSSSDDYIVNKSKRKRLRLLSQSSNETFVLDGSEKRQKADLELPCSSNIKMNDNIIDFVDIQSSSESESSKSNAIAAYPNFGTDTERVISEVIASCHKKFINKDDHSEKNNTKSSQLQHKILSMGRKVVNNKPFNCTGLLRYLENGNLDIQWIPKIGEYLDSDNVHLRTKLQDNKKEDVEIGWKPADELNDSYNDAFKEFLEKIIDHSEYFEISNEKANHMNDQAQVIPIPNASDSMLSRLLNTNPVPNPKKLPKKTAVVDGAGSSKMAAPVTNNVVSTEEPSLPVITNTVSLAGFVEKSVESGEGNVADKRDGNTSTYAPRIKVKPFSQLMAEKSAKPAVSLTPAQVAWTVPEMSGPHAESNPNLQNECVIMHTVELPHTKTLSPFKYFQNLLQLHGIILLDAQAPVSGIFACLIKFKSVFKQETKRVTLSLWLFSDSNQFYIKVTDSTCLELNVDTLIPSWQWEILSLYKSEISKNILQNAKKIGAKMYHSTHCFINLLRSIVFQKLPK